MIFELIEVVVDSPEGGILSRMGHPLRAEGFSCLDDGSRQFPIRGLRNHLLAS